MIEIPTECPPEINANNVAEVAVHAAADNPVGDGPPPLLLFFDRVCAASRRGTRERLEDSWTVVRCADLGGEEVTLLGVFDGVGGENGGEVASTLAKAAFAGRAFGGLVGATGPLLPGLEAVLHAANTLICEVGAAREDLDRMATTAIVAAVRDRWVALAWAGDSRGYRVGPEGVTCLTEDHADVDGALTQYLGLRGELRLGSRSLVLAPGDLLILVSDGVSDSLGEAGLAALCGPARTDASRLRGLADRLVEAALEAGSTDNVTAVCVLVAPQTCNSEED